MTRRFRIVVITGCVFLGTLFAFALIISFLLYTAPGRGLVEPIVGWASGGSVAVKGLSGDLPDSLRAETVEISDAQGIWLKLENVSLDWDAIAAIRDHIAIHSVSASKITVLRRPIEEKSSGTTLQIDIDALNAPDIEIAAAVAGRKTMLRASGSLHYLSRHRMRGDIAVAQIDGAGRYRINGGVANDVATGAIAISEDVGGILSSVLGMPGMGPISLSANAWNIDSKNSVAFTLSAGALRAKGGGTITLARREANVAIHAAAGEMQPNSDLSWQSLAFDGQMNGSFDAPHLNGRLSVLDAAVSGARMTAVEARVTGTRGSVELSGTIKGLRLPGGHPDLFAEAPVEIEARAELRAANRPITFKISHPLLAVSGRADTGDHVKLAAGLTLPSLQPFARIQSEDLHGAATIKLDVAQESDRLQFTVTGRVDAQGASLVARVLGRNASFAAHAT
ncbi:MAG TPA: hypothetical protein VHE09_12340, partial [Rhizomicrobium sp.]|nr:hypothetical protein [Rhizomicrobium sp.]